MPCSARQRIYGQGRAEILQVRKVWQTLQIGKFTDRIPYTAAPNLLVIDIARGDGIATGDQIELYKPRQRPADEAGLAIPELYIGRAQVLRVTPYGATAIITGHEQPRIEDGTSVRVAAKMP